MNPDPRLIRIMEGWLDGGLPEAEAKELFLQLESDQGLRKELAEQLTMSGALVAATQSEPSGNRMTDSRGM